MQTVLHVSQFDKICTTYISDVPPSQMAKVGSDKMVLENVFAQAQDNEYGPSACSGDLMLNIDTKTWYLITPDSFKRIFPMEAFRWMRISQEDRCLYSLMAAIKKD